MSQQINLYNPLFAANTTVFSCATMIKGLAVVLVGCSLLTVALHFRVNALTAAAEQAAAQLVEANVDLQQIRTQHAPRTKSEELEAQVQQTEQEMQALARVLDILNKGNIGNTEGYSSYMQALARQSVDGIWLTRFNIVGAGNKVELEGKAIAPELLPLYIDRLKKESIFQGKSFGTLEIAAPPQQAAQGDQAGRADKKAAVTQTAAGYIEFRLN